MRYSVLLTPDEDGLISVMVPAMPGCFSMGENRERALSNVRDAMLGWVEVEAERGEGPLIEAPAVIVAAVAEALEIIDELRDSGDWPTGRGYQLAIDTVDVDIQKLVSA